MAERRQSASNGVQEPQLRLRVLTLNVWCVRAVGLLVLRFRR